MPKQSLRHSYQRRPTVLHGHPAYRTTSGGHGPVLERVLPEPESCRFVVRTKILNLLPELLRMIEVYAVREFVDDHVVEDFGRRADEAPVEVEVALGAAGAPARFGGVEANFVERDAHLAGVTAGALDESVACEVPKAGFLVGREGRRLRDGPLERLADMLFDPRGLGLNEPMNARFAHLERRSDDEMALLRDVKRESAAA